jgi:hypothetical protein
MGTAPRPRTLRPSLAECGLPSRRAPVRLPGLASFAAAFVTYARGIAAVGQIDDLASRSTRS